MRGDRGLAVEVARQEDRLEQGLDLVISIAKNLPECRPSRIRDLLSNKVAIKLGGDELRRRGLSQDDVDDFLAAEIALAAQEFLGPRVMEIWVEAEL